MLIDKKKKELVIQDKDLSHHQLSETLKKFKSLDTLVFDRCELQVFNVQDLSKKLRVLNLEGNYLTKIDFK